MTRQSLDLALEGLDRASHSVEQLLALTRADARGGDVLASTPVDLHELAVWAVSTLSQKAYERDIDLGLAEAQHAEIMGDITALRTLLRNLVDNAIRYTPRGDTVTVAVGEDHEAKWVEVLDDGTGVSPGEQTRLLDRFHRGPEGQAMTTTGSGLGLSIVQRIARLHRATIRLGEGFDGRGLGVRILFPVGPDPRDRQSSLS
jgi:signal transduction histidine kinase